jgi:hypothetical protein
VISCLSPLLIFAPLELFQAQVEAHPQLYEIWMCLLMDCRQQRLGSHHRMENHPKGYQHLDWTTLTLGLEKVKLRRKAT